jgi:hypothetical protein
MESGGDENTKNLSISTKPNKDNGKPVTKEETAPSPSEDIVLEPVDRLMIENLQLKLMNVSARQESLRREAEDLDVAIGKLQQKYLMLLNGLSQKYGFDPATQEMEPDTGRVVPKGTVQR